ncbi:MAG: LysR substrate-binding domain-containing protein [Pseudomonadota bacterium]
MRTPNLNALRMFDAAARHLNFRLAAQELSLTQGAVAQQVRRLEADLGHKLFQREARGLVLTEIGRRYHEPVRRALSAIEDATLNLQPSNSTITLSVTPSFASKWLVPRLAGFAREHPELDLRTVASEGLSNFSSDGVDIAIRLGRPPFGPGLQTTLLAPVELCAVCSPAFASEAGPIDRIEQFADLRLVQDSHYMWQKLLDEAGVKPSNRMIQFNQTALAMDAAISDQGVALVPRLLLHDDVAEGRLVVLWRNPCPDHVGYFIVYPTASKPNPARDTVMNWVISEVG